MLGSAASFSTTSEMLVPMSWGFSSAALASDSRVRSFPSQPKRKLSAALNIVGVFSRRLEPSMPTSWLFKLAPFVRRSWHDEQLRELSCDSRGSPNRRSPSLIFSGSIAGGSGMGVIGSSATVLFDSGGCTSDCDVAEESCKLPSISAQITIPRRRRAVRAIPGSPGLGHCNKNFLNDIFAELWSERKYSAPDIDPPSNPILRHNSVHAETLADEQATRCMEEADSGDCTV